MYLVPQNQKNVYLKEISSLVKTIRDKPDAKGLESSADLNDIRNRLLDLISATKDTEGPDTRARMIRLEARLAATHLAAPLTLAGYTMEPVTVVAGPDLKPGGSHPTPRLDGGHRKHSRPGRDTQPDGKRGKRPLAPPVQGRHSLSG